MFLDMYCFHVFCCSGVNVLGDVIVFCWYIDSEIVRVRNVVGVCANGVVRICGVAGYFSFACIKKVVNPVRCEVICKMFQCCVVCIVWYSMYDVFGGYCCSEFAVLQICSGR